MKHLYTKYVLLHSNNESYDSTQDEIPQKLFLPGYFLIFNNLNFPVNIPFHHFLLIENI